MSKTITPQGYSSLLSVYETQRAIGLLKRLFEDSLSGALALRRVSAPLFVATTSGLNDDLSGVEKAVSFDIDAVNSRAAVVHSLAKWKRLALHDYEFSAGEGLVTDMNAIRRNEVLDNLHSAYVDQWDWEKVITDADRTTEYLVTTVTAIIKAMADTQTVLQAVFPQLCVLPKISSDITFITTQELEDLYPTLTSKERENTFVKAHPVTFLMQIGGKLKSGESHDGRAPDYDDWTLNGDILFWNETLGCAFELSSMGIRVSPASLNARLALAGCDDRRTLPFHKLLLDGELPLTMGGGIGQSRLSMWLLGKAHIGEVQVSLWDDETRNACADAGIKLL